jgi:hypothetical protein
MMSKGKIWKERFVGLRAEVKYSFRRAISPAPVVSIPPASSRQRKPSLHSIVMLPLLRATDLRQAPIPARKYSRNRDWSSIAILIPMPTQCS